MTPIWLLICFLLLFECSHQYSRSQGIHSFTFVSNLTWWDWKDIVQMWCAFLTIPFVQLDLLSQSCCAQYGGTGLCNVHTLYSFVLQEVKSVCCVWWESTLWPLSYQEGNVLQESAKARTTDLSSVSPVVLSTSSNPYLETERDDWALKPPFLWNSLPVGHSCIPLVCSVREVTTAVLGDQRVLGRLWFGGHIWHYCRFWAWNVSIGST